MASRREPRNALSISARIKVLDVLRGFALGGILIINAMSILAVKGSTPAFTIEIPTAERILQDSILFFVESKFFTLFSLLFGIGFAIQIQSATRQGAKFIPRISRRMAALLIFGLAHILLLWDGDILVIYSVTGTLLIFFRNVRLPAMKRWIVGLLAIPALIVFVIFVATLVLRLSPSSAESLRSSDLSIAQSFADTSATQRLLDAGFLEGVHERIATYLNLLPLLLSRIPTVLAMFLLGLYLGRGAFMQDLENRKGSLRKIRNRSLALGFGLMLLIVLATKYLPTTSSLIAIIEDQYLAGPILCLGYASTLTLEYLKNPNRKIFSGFAIVGRMALTNYILQSLMLAALSYGWGFGLALQLNGFQVLLISIFLYFAQILFSYQWLRRFNFGPLEWIWRCVTYWKWIPNKVQNEV